MTSDLDSATARFVESLAAQGSDQIYKLTVAEARAVLETVQTHPAAQPDAKVEQRTIPAGPTGQVSVRIVQPVDASGKLPVIVYIHGGGWILGSFKTHERLVREIAVGAEAAVVFVEYTPSPEAQYPTAIEEAYAATMYIAEHWEDLGLERGKLAIAGDSVGGNMAAAVTLLAKERGGPQIDLQALFYPVTDANFETETYHRFAAGPWLTKPAMEWFWNAYAPDPATRIQPTASPLQATLEQLQGLPPALIITDENDVLRHEGEAYAHKLMDAGVDVTAFRCLGTIHDFLLLNPIAATPPVRGAMKLAVSYLRHGLHG